MQKCCRYSEEAHPDLSCLEAVNKYSEDGIHGLSGCDMQLRTFSNDQRHIGV